MKFTKSTSINPSSFIYELIQKRPKNKSVKMLTVFIGASLLAAGLFTAIQSTKTNYKNSQCIQKKHCRCGNECSCGAACSCR